jgi:hypothetical protein
MLTSDTVDALPMLGHVGYLALWATVGWFLAVRYFERRLVV